MSLRTQLQKIFIYSIFSSYLFVMMEWLFFFTKPSFLNNWTLVENFTLLLISPLPLIAFSLIIFIPAIISVSLAPDSKVSTVFTIISLAAPATILTSLAFLLVENFTYTLWQFNIGNFQGIIRYLYTIAIIVFALWVSRALWKFGELSLWETTGRYLKLFTVVLLSGSILFSLVKYTPVKVISTAGLKRISIEFPNILILSSDGLDASHMSAYGYHRNTTPFIKSLIPKSLVIENHFTNCAKSTGSIGALWSGKLPTKTRVIYPPDIFRGIDVYQHMPAILKKLGYHNADFSLRHYTDPYDLNMREGFDFANGREIGIFLKNFTFPDFLKRSFMKESYFLEIIFSRLLVRLQHAFFISNMINPYSLVTNLNGADRYYPDSKRIEQLFKFIDSSKTPFFAHVHLMVTHGSKFHPEKQVFSIGQKQESNWMTDFYDDSVLNYDQTVQKVVNHLKKNNLFNKTLIILTSDHGTRWLAIKRIPLILHFPEQKFTGVLHNNVDRIDLTASIIDYIGIKKPEWMEGESFLQGELEPNRTIFFADSGQWGPQNSGHWRDVLSYKAPYYSLGGVGILVAQKWYFLDLKKKQFFSGVINDHTYPIGNRYLPNNQQAYDLIIGHLLENKYPVDGFIQN